jgi:glycosyltransferase involved in cell wall biosynthesis
VIDILIPTLGRAHALVPLLENIRATTPTASYYVWFVADEDDEESCEALDAAPPGRNDFTVLLCGGSYPTKINIAYSASLDPAALRAAAASEQLVLPTADDVRFYPGWLEAVLNALRDPSVQVVGSDDLTPATAGRKHATMPVLRRSYIEDPGAVWGETGTVFHEGYRHNFCETETWQLATHRGVTAWAEGAVIEHLHPSWGTREADATDAKGNGQGWAEDKALFGDRRAGWTA